MSRIFSYWEQKHYLDKIDVIIVGSGIVGLNAGIELLEKKPELRVLILERSEIPYGASTRNAGFACFGTASELLSELSKHSEQDVFGLFSQRFRGIQSLLNRVPGSVMDYKKEGGHEVFTENSVPSLIEINFLNQKIEEYLGIPHYFNFREDLIKESGLHNFSTLIYNSHEAVIDPMLMIDFLQKKFLQLGGKILCNAEVSSWKERDDNVEIKLDISTTIRCNKVLFAINGFAQKLFPQLDILAARNQVMIVRSKKKLLHKGCYHYNQGYVYFRTIDNKLLIGGGRHIDPKSEFSSDMDINPMIKTYLIDFINSHLIVNNEFTIENHWTGILGLGSERKPIIENISENVVIAVRLSGIGIAIGTSVGISAAHKLLT